MQHRGLIGSVTLVVALAACSSSRKASSPPTSAKEPRHNIPPGTPGSWTET